MAGVLEPVALTDIKNYTLNRIAHARYKIGSTYYTAAINDKQITPAGVVRVQFPIIPQSGSAVTVTEVQLISTAGAVWAKKTVSVSIETIQTGILFWFEFNLQELEV